MKLNFEVSSQVKKVLLRFLAGLLSAIALFVIFGGGAWAISPLIRGGISIDFYAFALRTSALIGLLVFVFLVFFTSDEK